MNFRSRWTSKKDGKHDAGESVEEIESKESSHAFGPVPMQSGLPSDDGLSEIVETVLDEPDAKKPKVEFRHTDDAGDPSANSSADLQSDPMEKTVGNALIKHTNKLQFKYPWEKGYLATFFDASKAQVVIRLRYLREI